MTMGCSEKYGVYFE